MIQVSGLMLADSVEPVAQISGGLAESLTFVADELLLLLWAAFKERDGQIVNTAVVPILQRYRTCWSANTGEVFFLI